MLLGMVNRNAARSSPGRGRHFQIQRRHGRGRGLEDELEVGDGHGEDLGGPRRAGFLAIGFVRLLLVNPAAAVRQDQLGRFGGVQPSLVPLVPAELPTAPHAGCGRPRTRSLFGLSFSESCPGGLSLVRRRCRPLPRRGRSFCSRAARLASAPLGPGGQGLRPDPPVARCGYCSCWWGCVPG